MSNKQMDNQTVNQHYVPKIYQKQWADREKHVFRMDITNQNGLAHAGQITRVAIKSNCSVDCLYEDVNIPKDSEWFNAVEKDYHAHEDCVLTHIRDLFNKDGTRLKRNLSKEDIDLIKKAVVIMLIRNGQKLKSLDGSETTIKDIAIDEARKAEISFGDKAITLDDFAAMMMSGKLSKYKEFLLIKMALSPNFIIMDTLVEYITANKKCFLINSPKDEFIFCSIPPLGPPGLSVILMPLNRHFAVVLCDAEFCDKYECNDGGIQIDSAKRWNPMFIDRSASTSYFSSNKETLLDFQKLINKQ